MCSWLDLCIPGWPWTGHSAWRATADCYRVGDGAGGRAKVGNRVGVLEDLEMRRRQVHREVGKLASWVNWSAICQFTQSPTYQCPLLAMRRAEAAVVVVVHLDVERLGDLPRL